ncbi:MAG TPA: GNAT family N-acetyltransferase [Saprospiraceae bacterium]|nr:GNAT family N-acetyltransferase [Saprospiraceae bacterium]HNT20836.1 GNAT family N-acetyltransferase [Saprospiraceae bacterium]
MDTETVLLGSRHRKTDFLCGKVQLDHYLHHQAGQDVKRKLAACFVSVDPVNERIRGYYTLSNYSLPLAGWPEQIKKKLPKSYLAIPVTLLGRLAVDHRYQGQGLGEWLLLDALYRSYTSSEIIGSLGVVTDPLDIEAENFYTKYGFIKLPDSGKMFIAMQTIIQLFQ